MSNKPTIAMILTDWNSNAYRQENDLYGGIGYYRVIKPAQVLREWFDVEVIGSEFRLWGGGDDSTRYGRLGRDYDLLFSKHIDNGQAASNLLAVADHYKKPVVVDIDDDYLNIRKDNPAFDDYAELKGGRYFLGAMLQLSTGLAVSTEPLSGLYASFNKNIDVLPNCNDVDDWNYPRKVHSDGKIRIGYAGGNAHGDDIKLVIEPIARILDENPNVLFQIMGAVTALEAKGIGAAMNMIASRDVTSQIQITGGTLAWREYPELLMSMGWDIGIAPLVDDKFNRSKSHIKWMEYSMMGAAVIASPVYPYKESIQDVDTIVHGQTGLFANSSQEWYESLSNLIKDESYRKELAKKAYKYIRQNWQYKQHATKWKAVIEKYL